MNRADRNHCRLAGFDLPAYNRLQTEDDFCRENDWVLRFVRISSMSANAMHDDINRIHIGQGITDPVTDRARRQLSVIVERQAQIRTRETREQTISQHGSRAADA